MSSDLYLSDPLVASHPRARPLMKLIALGLVAAVFIILIALVSYDIHLSKKIYEHQTANAQPTSTEGIEYREDITGWMDFSADPCTDFYQYSCGGYIDSADLPAGTDMYIPIFSQVQYDNYVVLNEIVNDQWPLIGDLYTSCMESSTTLRADSASTINAILSDIKQLNDTKPESLLPLLAKLHSIGVLAYFVPTQQENILQANSVIYFLVYGATLADDFTDPNTVETYNDEIFSSLSPFIANFTAERAQSVTLLEAAMTSVDFQPEDYSEVFIDMTWSEFVDLTGVDYTLYASEIGLNISKNDSLIVATPSFFANLTQFYNIELQTMTDYLMWRVLYSFQYHYPIFPSSLKDEENVDSGIKQQLKNGINKKSRSFIKPEYLEPQLTEATGFTAKQVKCIKTVDKLLGDYLGLIFTMKVLDDDVVNDIRTVTGGIQNSFKNNLASLSWIDTASRANATYKLNNIVPVIGHPNKLERYRGLILDSDHFLENIMAINNRVFEDGLGTIGTPYDRSQNEFPATIVNAFYNPEANTINFPAGILESPMFSTSFPKLMQYARMGYIIGHETTHGFDNHGRLWNAQGVYQPIMDETSDAQFTQRAQCIVDQYDKFEPVPGYFVDGQQTLGENIADLGGVKNAFLAYKAWVQANGTAGLALNAKSPIVPQLTNQQVFFVVMAQTWCTKANDAGLIDQIQTDVHSPSQYRVNGPLSNLDLFSDAFQCKEGTPMNTHPKCELW